ncbi:MAG: 3-hydroxyacyl-ACP dehydratase FabZ [Bauldia sp.]|nr:3-hydroxyacyl-ACP dehydratase FabZ [Bauldia sp.]
MTTEAEAATPPVITLETLDIQQILALLPHRYPFLMVDRIIEIDADRSAIGIKNVTVNEPHFLGHFPTRPVMPGVLILEAMAQTAGAICLHFVGRTAPGAVYLTSIDAAKFRRPVVPGDQVRIHVSKLRQKMNLWKFRAEAKVDGLVVAEAEVSAVMSEAAV